MARIPAPPRLARVHPTLGAPNSNMAADTARERARHYAALHKEAWDRYRDQAVALAPPIVRAHDGGMTWLRYHRAAFDAVNPPPGELYPGPPPPGAGAGPLPPPPLLENVRQRIIEFNELQPIYDSQQLAAFFRPKPIPLLSQQPHI